jgi:hypothetical protein
MKSFAKFYTESLYPFQDGVLKLVHELATPFYLTGGTALSRHYFNHRYSDDLALFVNQNDRYGEWIQHIYSRFESASRSKQFIIDHNNTIRGDQYTLFILTRNGISLKVELINDVAQHFGDFEQDKILGKVDSWLNILSNKLTALGRLEIKDFVDLWMIAKKRSFDWPKVFGQAKTKDAGLDPVMIYELLESIPSDAPSLIKWGPGTDAKSFFTDMKRMAQDMIKGQQNSLYIF